MRPPQTRNWSVSLRTPLATRTWRTGQEPLLQVPDHVVHRRSYGVMTRVSRRATVCAVVWLLGLSACHSSPTQPGDMPLANARWSGDGACLSVTDTGCNLAVGCGHGQFPKPTIRSDGTFDVDGTYRIEIGPISGEPAPPAHFSGSLVGSTLRLNVVPSVRSLPAASYSMTPSSPGTCPVPCL
jgi:hypothetical protein